MNRRSFIKVGCLFCSIPIVPQLTSHTKCILDPVFTSIKRENTQIQGEFYSNRKYKVNDIAIMTINYHGQILITKIKLTKVNIEKTSASFDSHLFPLYNYYHDFEGAEICLKN